MNIFIRSSSPCSLLIGIIVSVHALTFEEIHTCLCRMRQAGNLDRNQMHSLMIKWNSLTVTMEFEFTILACLNTEGWGGWSWSHSNSFNHKFVCVVWVEWTECVLCVDRGVLELSSCVHFCDIDDVHSNQSILMFKWWWTPLEENAFRVKSIPTSILWPGRRSCRQETDKRQTRDRKYLVTYEKEWRCTSVC